MGFSAFGELSHSEFSSTHLFDNKDNNPLQSSVIKHLSFALKAPHLRVLSLENCGVDDSGAADLAFLLRRSPTLLKLNLEGNKISDDGTEKLAENLGFLTHLDLEKNKIGRIGRLPPSDRDYS